MQVEKDDWKQVDTFPKVEVSQVDLPLLVARALPNVITKTNTKPVIQEEIEAMARQLSSNL